MVSDGKTYPDFLDDMGKLLQSAMPRTDRERDELYAAEAECRRLREQLAVANERRELAFTRYNRERDLLREMFETWKSEVMTLPAGEPCNHSEHQELATGLGHDPESNR